MAGANSPSNTANTSLTLLISIATLHFLESLLESAIRILKFGAMFVFALRVISTHPGPVEIDRLIRQLRKCSKSLASKGVSWNKAFRACLQVEAIQTVLNAVRCFLDFGVAVDASKKEDESSESVGSKNDKRQGAPNGEEPIDGALVGS